MKTEDKLRLQAYLDNEVSSSDARQIAAWITRDTEANALFEQLKGTKQLLAGNELQPAVPAGHDFYWSQIQKRIAAAEAAPALPAARPWWFRLLAPVAACAAVAILLFSSVSFNRNTTLSSLQAIEQGAPETGAITFYSQTHGMTVVFMPQAGQDSQPVDDDWE